MPILKGLSMDLCFLNIWEIEEELEDIIEKIWSGNNHEGKELSNFREEVSLQDDVEEDYMTIM